MRQLLRERATQVVGQVQRFDFQGPEAVRERLRVQKVVVQPQLLHQVGRDITHRGQGRAGAVCGDVCTVVWVRVRSVVVHGVWACM